MAFKEILATAFILTAPAAWAQDFGGEWALSGTNLDGTPYEGTVTITVLSDTTCQIDWYTGDTQSTGICMRYGPAFAAAYTLGDAVGLVIYQIMDDNTLDGTLTHHRDVRRRHRGADTDVTSAPRGNQTGHGNCKRHGQSCARHAACVAPAITARTVSANGVVGRPASRDNVRLSSNRSPAAIATSHPAITSANPAGTPTDSSTLA